MPTTTTNDPAFLGGTVGTHCKNVRLLLLLLLSLSLPLPEPLPLPLLDVPVAIVFFAHR